MRWGPPQAQERITRRVGGQSLHVLQVFSREPALNTLLSSVQVM